MLGLTKEMINDHSSKEDLLLEALIAKRGIDVTLLLPVVLNADGTKAHGTYDDFETDVTILSAHGQKNSNVYDESRNDLNLSSKLYFDHGFYGEFHETNHQDILRMLANADINNSTNSFNNLSAYIIGSMFPVGTLVSLNDFNEMRFRIASVEKKRQTTRVHRYKMSRA